MLEWNKFHPRWLWSRVPQHKRKQCCVLLIFMLGFILVFMYKNVHAPMRMSVWILNPPPESCSGSQTGRSGLQISVPRTHTSSVKSCSDPQESWVTVAGTKTLLRSAYREHRTGKEEVRVISVVLRSEKATYHCSLCCQGHLNVSEGIMDITNSHFDFPYGTAYIMCPIPAGCGSPSHIAVTSAGADGKPDQKFLQVKNQEVRRDSFPYSFTVCYSVMYDFTNVLQLVQSLEVLQLLGVNKVVIYKTSCSQETERVLEYYTQRGLVEVIPWSLSKHLNVSRGWRPNLSPGDIHYYGQIPALNDCVYRYMYRSRYVALHDPDELILPQAVKSWSELLPLLEKKHGVDKCYMFENYVFPILKSSPDSTTKQPQSWRRVPGENILDQLRHYPFYPKFQCERGKIIVNPRTVFLATVHGLLEPRNDCRCVDRNTARMYHIRAPYESYRTDNLVYDGRLLEYSDGLVSSVTTVLEESGLLEKRVK